MSGMKQLDRRGHLNTLLIPLIMVSLLVIVAGSAAIWAYMGRQDYKDNSDKKVAAAVTIAEQQTSTKKDNEFIEKEKSPLRTYNGPAAFGSLVIQYPKTWSAYVAEKPQGSIPIDNYFQPNFVPSVDNDKQVYALRVQLVDIDYATVLKTFDTAVKAGKVKVTAYVPAKVASVTGVRIDGAVTTTKQGSMVIMPLRDKTLKLWTESPDYLNDFNNNILPNYSFSQ
jgi:hypothetical protein